MWDDGSNTDLSKFPEADQTMLHRYVKLWTNFVKYRYVYMYLQCFNITAIDLKKKH